MSVCLHRKSKTKPNGKKPPTEEKKPYLEPDCTKVRVVDFDLKELVVLPPEIDLNEWLASNSKCIKFPVLVLALEQILLVAFDRVEPVLTAHFGINAQRVKQWPVLNRKALKLTCLVMSSFRRYLKNKQKKKKHHSLGICPSQEKAAHYFRLV